MRPDQRFIMMGELVILAGLDVHQLVVRFLQLDGAGGAVGRLLPFADAHGQMGLHVVGVRNARGRHRGTPRRAASRAPGGACLHTDE